MDAREDDEDDACEATFHRKLPWGSELYRQTVAFVPSSEGALRTTDYTSPKEPSQSVADLYLSMVLPEDSSDPKPDPEIGEEQQICDICKLPLDSNPRDEVQVHDDIPPRRYPSKHSHENSLAHQVCRSHVHPPSSLNRTRLGIRYLKSHGWDPDSRQGLGASQQGIQFPLKAKLKDDTLGIGAEKSVAAPKKEKVKLLDAGKVRKMALEDMKKTAQLRNELFGNRDLAKYLGPGAT